MLKICRLNPTFTLMPGDELRLTCSFKTTARNHIIYYGEGTSDEMCYSFIFYYPDTAVDGSCIELGTLDLCKITPTKLLRFDLGDCDLSDEASVKAVLFRLSQACDTTGMHCTDSCKEFFNKNTHPCLKGNAKMFVEFALPLVPGQDKALMEELVRASRSCDSVFYDFEAGVYKTNSASLQHCCKELFRLMVFYTLIITYF